MNEQIVFATIDLVWTANGSITTNFYSEFDLDETIKKSLLGYSSLVCLYSQLGVLTLQNALLLCRVILDIFENNQISYEPINPVLQGAEVAIMRGDNIFHLFNPKVSRSNNDEIEKSICQFLSNFIIYSSSRLEDEYIHYRVKLLVLYILKIFLDEIVYPFVKSGGVNNLKQSYSAIHSATIKESILFHNVWDEYCGIDINRKKTDKDIQKIIQISRKRLNDIYMLFNWRLEK